MAMWYQARQIADGPNKGKWRYTAASDEGGFCYALGACADGCPGHDTAEEAERHHAEGVCAGEIDERDLANEMKRCIECDEFTQHIAMFRGTDFPASHHICASHDIRAALRKKHFEKRGLTP